MRRANRGSAIRAMVLMMFAATLAACSEEAVNEAGPGYQEEIERFRADREARLAADEGWLTLVGLHWLQPGSNRVGSDPANEVVLPSGAAPPLVATLHYEQGRVSLVAHGAADVTIDGREVRETLLRDDSEGTPDRVRTGRITFYVIARGGRHGIRVKDPESEARLGFRGLDFYPVDPSYRVIGRLEPYPAPRPREVATVIGTTADYLAPGLIRFEVDGRGFKLEPLIAKAGDTELFLIFRDGTSGRETYGAGRFLDATLDGTAVVLDFNRAYSPPCAFTAFATCPLPPPDNRLDVDVRAGEKNYVGHGAHD